MRTMSNAHIFTVEDPEEKRPFKRSSRRWEYTIKKHLKEEECENVD
jgi:hypothetical protein